MVRKLKIYVDEGDYDMSDDGGEYGVHWASIWDGTTLCGEHQHESGDPFPESYDTDEFVTCDDCLAMQEHGEKIYIQQLTGRDK